MKVSISTILLVISIYCTAQEVDVLMKQKSKYDQLQSNGGATLRTFMRTAEGELKKLNNEKWTDSTTLMYKVFSRDEKIILIGVYEKEGDWDGQHSYYFDQDGRVFSYVHNLNSFNTRCADTLELKTLFFFDKNSDILHENLTITNEFGEVVSSDSCIYKNPYKHYFYSDLEEFMLKVENYRAIDKKY